MWVLVLLLLVACGSDRVALAYRLDPGRSLRYRLEITADVDRTLSGEARFQTIGATFATGQEIVALLPGGGAEARMSLRPESLLVDGEPVEAGPSQEFLVTLAEDGRIVGIERAREADEGPLAEVGIERLLPRLRPVLPGRDVRPGDTWRSTAEFEDAAGRFALEFRSRLAALGRMDGAPSALVRTTYVSPVDREETFANAVANIRGVDTGAQEAWFSLDGFLLRATSDSIGRFEVTFRPPGGETGIAPVEGTLVVRLHTELRLVA